MTEKIILTLEVDNKDKRHMVLDYSYSPLNIEYAYITIVGVLKMYAIETSLTHSTNISFTEINTEDYPEDTP